MTNLQSHLSRNRSEIATAVAAILLCVSVGATDAHAGMTPSVSPQSTEKPAPSAAKRKKNRKKAETGPTAPQAQMPPTQLREVVVTGSRIATRQAHLTAFPVDTVVNAAYMTEHGYTNIANALNTLPEMQGSTTPAGAQNSFGVGVNYVNLYGLGSNRTLGLVNGLRYVSDNPANIFANSGGTQVDLNNFPSLFLKQVQIVPASGAAVYGADAVAGVVNIEMRQHFVGEEFQGSVTNSAQWDAGEYDAEVALGRDFLHHKLNLAFDAEYDQTTAVSYAQRPWGSIQQQFVPNPSPTGPASIVADNARFYGVTNGGLPVNPNTFGLIYLPGTNTPAMFANNGNLVPFNPGIVYGPSAYNGLNGNPLYDSQSSGGDSLNLAPLSSLQAPLKRALFYGIASYNFSRSLHFRTSVSLNYVGARQAYNQPNYSYTGFGTSAAVDQPGPGTAWLINATNPFLNSQAQSVLAADGITQFYLNRSNVDATPSPINAFVRTFNINSELSGDFHLLSRRFDWNVSYSHGEAYSSYSNYNFVYGNPTYNIPNVLGYALNSVMGANGQPECSITQQNPNSTNPYIANCIPFDPFGVGNNSAAAIRYVTANFGNTAVNWQDDAQANIQAPLFSLPAGKVRMSAGVESRYEYASFNPSLASREGIGYSVAINATHGHFATHEVYTEMRVPLLGNRYHWKFAHTLSFDAAFRRVDSSLAGYNNAWNFGVVFAPTRDIAFRFGKARTYREPSLQEAFSPSTNAYDYGTDPCTVANITSGPNPAARQANCAKAFAAIGANLATFTSSNVENFTIPVTAAGNPSLTNETAHSMNLGVILTPRWVPGLTVSADYIQILISQAIEYAGVGVLMEQCYDAPTYPTATCNDFTRQAGTGQVISAHETFINAGFNHLRLIQYKLNYDHSLKSLPLLDRFADPGRMSFAVNAADMRENNSSVSGKGFDVIESANTIGLPRWSFQATLGYHRGPLRAYWQTNYTSREYFNLTYTASNQLPLTIPSSTIHNIDVLYNFGKHYQVGVHVFNVFNKAPPQPWTYGPANLGRMFELSARADF
ncbi:MAG: TonB-dependent receptor [Pseudomonadota bacterium]|jgi:outer membrane receptor protein involved in Fe transport|nr:TonB-dependent receptor [Pseudomonadota bacterium]